MPHELDKILISESQKDFDEKIIKIRAAVVNATHLGSSEDKRLDDILERVSKRKDSAVAEYTEKFDGVKLTQEQFRISKEELKKARPPKKKSTKIAVEEKSGKKN